jgi:colanic acid/amylovoran biosynthesis glycosyltransferase
MSFLLKRTLVQNLNFTPKSDIPRKVHSNENIHFQIHDLGLIECVTFINGLPHHEVIDKLSSNDLFLLPSLAEGISNAVLEATALGIPVISTDCGGMTEIIKDEDIGQTALF